MVGIYKITNPKGKIYIGQSIDIERRFKEYKRISKRSAGRKIIRSLEKYGVENHIFEIIEECLRESLHEREYFWKQHYTSVENGLNCDYFGAYFISLDELIEYVVLVGMDPNYEITRNGKPTGEYLNELIGY